MGTTKRNKMLIHHLCKNKACYLRAVGSATTSDACVTLGVLTLPAIKQVKQAGLTHKAHQSSSAGSHSNQ